MMGLGTRLPEPLVRQMLKLRVKIARARRCADRLDRALDKLDEAPTRNGRTRHDPTDAG